MVDHNLGLVITVAHIVFDLHSSGKNLEEHCYHGLADAKIVLGILKEVNSYKAVYQYFGEIVCHGVQVCDGMLEGVDACVICITSGMTEDVDAEFPVAFPTATSITTPSILQNEKALELLTAIMMASGRSLKNASLIHSSTQWFKCLQASLMSDVQEMICMGLNLWLPKGLVNNAFSRK